MKEWPDKRLDELFRKSAEGFKQEYDPNDWNELRKRLDDEDKPIGTPWWKKVGLGLAIALLLGSIAGISFYLLSNEAGSENKAIQSLVTKMNSARYEGKTREEIKDIREIAQQIEEKRILPRSRPKASGVRLRTARSGSGRGAGAFFSNSNKNTEIRSVLTKEENKLAENEFISEEKEGESGKWDGAELVIKNEDKGLNRRIVSPGEVIGKGLEISSRPVKWPNVIFVDSSSILVEETKIDGPVSFHQWAIRVGVSPDLSTVGLKNFSSPKTAVGLLVEYGINRRFFVQSGIVRSLKVYTAKAGDYQLPAGVKQSVYPSSVDGECVVLEVPLNLRYTVFNHERSSWFVTGGISSYQMRKENYDYHYDKHYPGVKYGWSGKTGWYLLSHLNASIGYEYKINKRLSLVAEPYLRLPIKRVGYGKVNLITTGAWLSIRYAPVRRK